MGIGWPATGLLMPMNSLPGFRDFFPEQLALRRHIFGQWRETARRYGFREYDGPPLEPLELYTQKSGAEIVSQLFNFVDKGDREVALRPEMTPTLARMVGAHHRDYKKPIKWFAIPQLFRYEKQQRGRLREHFQFNADIIGETDVAADAELIALAVDSLRGLGLNEQDIVVRIADRRAWLRHLNGLGIAPEQHHAVLQVVDKLERETPEKTRENLVRVTHRVEEVLAFAAQSEARDELADLFAHLGDLAKYCAVDFKIVRGLAYYTGIVWEIHDRRGALRAIAGGGRYDNLIQQLTGVELPALGFGMGDVTVGELLKECGRWPKLDWGLDCYVVIADEGLRAAALRLIHELRDSGVAADYSLTPAKIGKQFQIAASLGAKHAIVVGPEEWSAGEVVVKDLARQTQERVKVLELRTKLS
jgi:histidyl-tRNA synthetase